MEQYTVKGLANSLRLAFQTAKIDPAKDTIVSAIGKFHKLGLRHLVLYIEDGGFLCLCSDSEMSKKLKSAIEMMDNELDGIEENQAGANIQ